MKFVGTAFVVSLFASVVAYGHQCRAEDLDIGSPMPGYYEHRAALFRLLRLEQGAVTRHRASPGLRSRTGGPASIG